MTLNVGHFSDCIILDTNKDTNKMQGGSAPPVTRLGLAEYRLAT